MKDLIKKLLPVWLKKRLRLIVKFFKYHYRCQLIKGPISRNEKIKIIVGAAETFQQGWYSTNEQWLDITKEEDWTKVFSDKKIITNVVAEHVFEHLTKEQCLKSLQNIHKHMIQGGRVRIAVPDGYNPDPDYLRHVGIAGIGDDAADHKQLLNVDVLKQLFADIGFEPNHVEGYTKDGTLITNEFLDDEGFIYRSRKHSTEKRRQRWAFADAETSLIVDGIKL